MKGDIITSKTLYSLFFFPVCVPYANTLVCLHLKVFENSIQPLITCISLAIGFLCSRDYHGFVSVASAVAEYQVSSVFLHPHNSSAQL